MASSEPLCGVSGIHANLVRSLTFIRLRFYSSCSHLHPFFLSFCSNSCYLYNFLYPLAFISSIFLSRVPFVVRNIPSASLYIFLLIENNNITFYYFVTERSYNRLPALTLDHAVRALKSPARLQSERWMEVLFMW